MASTSTALFAIAITATIAREHGLFAGSDEEFDNRPVTYGEGDDKVALPNYIYTLDDGSLVAVRVDDDGAFESVAQVEVSDGAFYWADSYEQIVEAEFSDDDSDSGDTDQTVPAEASDDTDDWNNLVQSTPTATTPTKQGRRAAHRQDTPAEIPDNCPPMLAQVITEANEAITTARLSQAIAAQNAAKAQNRIQKVRTMASEKLPNTPTTAEAGVLWTSKIQSTNDKGQQIITMVYKSDTGSVPLTFSKQEIKDYIASRGETPTPDVLVAELFENALVAPVKRRRELAAKIVEQLEGYRLNDDLPGGAVKNSRPRDPQKAKIRRTSRKISAEQKAAAQAELNDFLK